MEIHLIVAAAEGNNGIGKNNDLLWNLSADMQYFKETTIGFPVIMGRKNYESIPKKYRPLVDRENIILTRDSNYKVEDAFVVYSIDESIEKAKSFGKTKCFVIGGGEIYKAFLDKNLVTKMHVSWIKGKFDADTFFPEIDSDKWETISENERKADARNKYDIVFTEYALK